MPILKLAPEMLVLLVNEDPVLRLALSTMLEDANCVVAETGAIKDAENFVRRIRFDLALVDLAAEADAEDAARRIQRESSEIVIVSARGVIRRAIGAITRLLESSPETPLTLELLIESVRD